MGLKNNTALRDRNAYLTISAIGDRFVSQLFYVEYDTGRRYVLEDQVYLNPANHELTDEKFWEEYFDVLQDKHDWAMLDELGNYPGIKSILPFEAEFHGLSGIELVFSENFADRHKAISLVRKMYPEISVRVINSESLTDSLVRLINKLDYDSITYVGAQIDSYQLICVRSIADKKGRGKDWKGIGIGSKDYAYIDKSIKWDTRSSIASSYRDKRVKAFTTFDSNDSVVTNQWANYVHGLTTQPFSDELKDLIRSFVTVQILSLKNSVKEKLYDTSEKNLVIFSSPLNDVMSRAHSYLCIVDGLQLRGCVDIMFDSSLTIPRNSKVFNQAIASAKFIMPRESFIKGLSRCLIMEVPGKKGSPQSTFHGSLISGLHGQKDVYMLSDELVSVGLRAGDKGHFTGSFVKDAYVDGMEGSIDIPLPEDSLYDSIIVDSRFKPVIYGPDFRANKNNLVLKLREESL